MVMRRENFSVFLSSSMSFMAKEVARLSIAGQYITCLGSFISYLIVAALQAASQATLTTDR